MSRPERSETHVSMKDRACLWCDEMFTPGRTISGQSTENYCQPDCGWKAHHAKQAAVVFGEGMYDRLRAEARAIRLAESEVMKATPPDDDKEDMEVTPRKRKKIRQPPAAATPPPEPEEASEGTKQMTLKDVRTKVLMIRKTDGRLHVGLTHEEFAQIVGSKRSTVFHWETGRSPVPIRFIEKIQELVNEAVAMQPEYLAQSSPPPAPKRVRPPRIGPQMQAAEPDNA